MKDCSVCGTNKPAGAFQVRKASKDGRTAACRECLHERDRIRFTKERDSRREWSRRYYHGIGRQVVLDAGRRWRMANQDKRAAHVITGNAIRRGQLVKAPCEVCGSTDVHAHHDDYGQPLIVRWLCPMHHAEHHRTLKGTK